MTRLIVGAVAVYVAGVAALVALTAEPSQLLEPVPWYRMMVFWLMPETSAERIIALSAAGRDAECLLYALVVGLSAGLLGGLAMFGAGVALATNPRRRLLPRLEATLFLCLLVSLALMKPDPAAALVRILETRELVDAAGVNAMPGYWIAVMVLSCCLFARYAALLAHDAAAWASAAWSNGVWSNKAWMRLAGRIGEWRARPPARAILSLPIGFTPPPSWGSPRPSSPRSAPR
jgi:hypothetical protein